MSTQPLPTAPSCAGQSACSSQPQHTQQLPTTQQPLPANQVSNCTAASPAFMQLPGTSSHVLRSLHRQKVLQLPVVNCNSPATLDTDKLATTVTTSHR